MEKTELETLLENKLRIKGIDLGKRIYIESLLGQGLIDDAFNKVKNKENNFARFLGLAGNEYSESQMILKDKFPIVFRRQSESFNKFRVQYEVMAPQERYLTRYETASDELILNKKYDYESVIISYFKDKTEDFWTDGETVLHFTRKPEGTVSEVTQFNGLLELNYRFKDMFDSLKKKEKTFVSADELARFALSFLILDGGGD